jgi:Spy/CpxP family protein refolding chaperone
MTKTTNAFLFAASMLFATACDPVDEPTTERAAEVEVDSKAAGEDHHGKDGEHGKFAADKLCSELECSEAQATQISELFAGKHESRDEGDREARKVARAEGHKALAAAFRAESFDVTVLERGKPEHDGDHEARMLEFATQLHAILTPAQRAKLADRVEADGPMFFLGKRGHGKRGPHGEGHGPGGDGQSSHGEAPDGVDGPHGDSAERVAQHVSRLCEKVICTPEQQAQLTQFLTSAHEARRGSPDQREKPDASAVAALLRADTLDTAKLSELMTAGKAEHEARKAEHEKAFGEVVAGVHGILTAEQRAIVADLIEADGLHALMGGKGGKHGKRGKPGKRGEHQDRD